MLMIAKPALEAVVLIADLNEPPSPPHGTHINAIDKRVVHVVQAKRLFCFHLKFYIFSFLYFLYESDICLHHLHHYHLKPQKHWENEG